MFGRWLRFLAVAAAYAVSIFLLWRAAPSSLTSPWFVFAGMIGFLGLAFVAHPVVPIGTPAAWRRIRAWEADGRLYGALGVPAFGMLLRRTPLRLLNTGVYLRGRGDRAAAGVIARLEAAEASHVWDAVLVVPYMVYAGLHGAWATLFWFSVAQAAVNAYPVAHLRLARHRLQRLVAKHPHNGPCGPGPAVK